MLVPDVWIRFELLLLIRNLAPFKAATVENVRHVRHLFELARPLYQKVADLVDVSIEPRTGLGGRFLPWPADSCSAVPIIY